jgi:lysophospholipase L1-like esterase
MLYAQIAMVLENTHYDIIHFNNGMHGWRLSEEEYRKSYSTFVQTIRSHAPAAKLICATTTPLKESTPTKPEEARASDERITARNTYAGEIVKPLGINVDDLFTPVKGHPELHSDNVHFTPQGYSILAQQVSAEIEKLLAK